MDATSTVRPHRITWSSTELIADILQRHHRYADLFPPVKEIVTLVCKVMPASLHNPDRHEWLAAAEEEWRVNHPPLIAEEKAHFRNVAKDAITRIAGDGTSKEDSL